MRACQGHAQKAVSRGAIWHISESMVTNTPHGPTREAEKKREKQEVKRY